MCLGWRGLFGFCSWLRVSLSVQHGLWGFACVLLFPKLVLRSPPRAGRKKHHLVGAMLQDQLQQWMTGTGIPDLWYAVCAERASSGSSVSVIMIWLNQTFDVP